VRDVYNNPVENGTAVYFTIDNPTLGFINPESYTGGGYPCVELEADPIKGVARACFTYPSESIFECYALTATTSGGVVQGEIATCLPIVDASLAMQAIPGSISGTAGGTADIYVTVWDHYLMHAIDNAPIVFSVDGDGYVDPSFNYTDDSGFPLTTLTVPDSTEAGTTRVKAKLWMLDVESEVEITITD
jgi:hypothetical protein